MQRRTQYTDRFRWGITCSDDNFSLSNHLFICGSPFFLYRQDAGLFLNAFDVIRFQWIVHLTGSDCDYYYSAWDSQHEGEREGEQEATSPPAKINLVEDYESSILMSLHSHGSMSLLLFWSPARKKTEINTWFIRKLWNHVMHLN